MLGQLTFTAPLLLAGLLAAAVPIVLHLLSTVQAPQVPFPTLRFLRRSMQKTARRRKIQNLLLLLLRTGLIVAVVLALSQPVLKLAGLAPTGAQQAAVVVVDNSLSMQTRADNTTRYELARQAARELLTGPNRPASAVVMATNGPAAGLAADWLGDVHGLTERLAAAAPTGAFDDLAQAVQASAAPLAEAPQPNTSIWLFTDLQRVSAERLSQVSALSTPALAKVPVFILDAARGRARNVAVTDVRLLANARVVGARARVSATVQNSSDSPQRATVGLEVAGQRLLDQPIQLGARGSADAIRTVTFDYRFAQPGPVSGRVLLEGQADDLPADDSRWFAVDVKDKLRAVVLSAAGSGSGRVVASHAAYYVQAALRTSPSLQARVESPATFDPGQLAQVDVLVLADPGPVPDVLQQAIDRWVTGGGVLVVFMGPQTDLENLAAWADRAGSALAARPIELRVARENEPMPVQQADLTSVLLSGLFSREQDYAGIFATRHVQVQPLAGATAVLKFRSGDPLVLDRPVGRGRCVQVTTSPHAAWTNLPTQGLFVALLHRAAAAAAAGAGGADLLPGQTIDLPAQPGQVVEVTTPATGTAAGRVVRLTCGPSASAVRFADAWTPGVHTWSVVGGGAGGTFAVNVDARESDLSAVDAQQVRSALPGRAVVVGGDLASLKANVDELAAGSGLWDGLLFAALLFALFEVFLANRHKPVEGPLPGPAAAGHA